MAFPPDGQDGFGEAVGTRVEDQVERRILEARQIGHVALHSLDLETVALGHHAVLTELSSRVVEDGYVRPGRSQDRPLLAPARRQTQHSRTVELEEPLARHPPTWRENDRPVSLPGSSHLIRIDRDRPLVLIVDFPVPGVAVESDDIHGFAP